MVKYLQQLLSDVEHSIELASVLPEQDWFPDYEDEDEEPNLVTTKQMKLGDIYDLPSEAFPPEQLLTDTQILQLTDGIHRLWSSWRLWWNLPKQLTDRQHYSALLHTMQHSEVAWAPTKGGDVEICQYEAGEYCPFGNAGGYCHCKVIDDTVQHDLANWEEHVRSQGLDPYRELSEEEGKAFEENMRNHQIRKQFGDDWEKFCALDFYPPFDLHEEDSTVINNGLAGEDWVEEWLWDNEDVSSDEEDSVPNNLDEDWNENLLDGLWDDADFD